jgi:mono/diheme cytochrome c family protein
MTLSTNLQISLALCAVAATAVAEAHGGHTSPPTHKPTPEEIAAFEAAKPVFERHCFRCHTTGGKKSKRKALAPISMDHYPFGGHHADEVGTVVRKVLGGDGNGKATMPSDDPGAVRGDELAKIVAWAAAFDQARVHPAKRDDPSAAEGPAHAH